MAMAMGVVVAVDLVVVGCTGGGNGGECGFGCSCGDVGGCGLWLGVPVGEMVLGGCVAVLLYVRIWW